jgi:probable blue pigment (indigoidine) exporter
LFKNLKPSFFQYILTGLLFSALWASASIAGKFGLLSVEPLLFFQIRFLGAGFILLAYAHGWKRWRVPSGVEWKHIAIFSAFNTALYLGIFIIALQYITAGITALAIALNPLLISLMSSVGWARKVKPLEWISIVMGLAGVMVAAIPLLAREEISITGLLLLMGSMLMYSFGAVYFASIHWKLNHSTINGWQVLLGGVLIAPFTWLLHSPGSNHFDLTFWFSLFWLIVPVSIIAVNLWLVLLQADAVRASIWLYLCPIFGLLLSAWLLKEPLTVYTAVGTVLVLSAIFIGQQKSKTLSVNSGMK